MEVHCKEYDFEVDECGLDSRHLLCNWCLVSGRVLTEVVQEQELSWYFQTIGTSISDEVQILKQIPQICWECRAMLKRIMLFKARVQESYEKLQIFIKQEDEFQAAHLQPEHKPSRFDTFNVISIDIQPVSNKSQIPVIKEEAVDYDIDIEEHTDSPSAVYLSNNHDKDVLDMYADSEQDAGTAILTPSTTQKEADWSIAAKKEHSFYECDKCGDGFLLKMPLIRHITKCYVTTTYRQRSTNKRNNSAARSKRAANDGEKRLKCTVCSARFKQTGHLNVHMRRHADAKPYKCTQCSYASSRYDCLKRHSYVHSEHKPLSCETCGAAFTQASNLAKHVRVHTGARPYKCDVCPYSSPRGDDLKNHLKRHFNQRSYVCGLCGASFVVAHELTIHLRKHAK